MSRMLVPLSLQEPGFANHWPDKGAERLLVRLERARRFGRAAACAAPALGG